MSERAPPRPFELDPTRADLLPEPPPSLPAVSDEDGPEPLPPPAPRGWRGTLLKLFGIGVLGALVFQTVAYVDALLTTNPVLGWPLAAFLVLMCASLLGWVGIEVRDIRRLSERASLRHTAERLAYSDLHGEAEALLAEVTAEIGRRPELVPALTRFRESASDALSDSERLRLYEKQVLAPVDRLAYRLVVTGGRDIGILTALSPLGLLDSVVVLWRTTAMLRAVARLYGMAPGPVATLSLLRRCGRNAVLAGVADVISNSVLEHVGAGLVALLSERATQGVGNALLASRLGLEAMRQCRPLPFVAEEPPRLSRMRRSLIEGLSAKRRP